MSTPVPSSWPPPSEPKSGTKLPIPPPWYSLKTTTTTTTTNSQLHIALPQISISTSDNTQKPRPPIFLTAFHPNDAPALQAILSLPEINSSLIRVPTPYTLADAQAWIDLQSNPDAAFSSTTNSNTSSPSSAPPPTPWLQALRTTHPDGTGIFIGAASLTPIAAPEPAFSDDEHDRDDARHTYELGYYLHPTFQGRGIMSDAVAAVIAWGVAEKGVRVVDVEIAGDNVRSRRVVEGLEGWERVVFGEGGGGNGGDGEGALEVEVAWPEGKGGGFRRMRRWRWRSGLLDGGASGREGGESGA